MTNSNFDSNFNSAYNLMIWSKLKSRHVNFDLYLKENATYLCRISFHLTWLWLRGIFLQAVTCGSMMYLYLPTYLHIKSNNFPPAIKFNGKHIFSEAAPVVLGLPGIRSESSVSKPDVRNKMFIETLLFWWMTWDWMWSRTPCLRYTVCMYSIWSK